MDLARELLDVLDNPARVWDAIVENMADEQRIALLTFTTCSSPLDIVEWQNAVARVSLEAAAKFESSLRVLDDAFVKIERRLSGDELVSFRNPSMDDFCAMHLDANAGFATSVAAKAPSIEQVRRLIQLAAAQHPADRNLPRYPNLRAALITHPELLLARLLELLPDDSGPTAAFVTVTQLIIQLVGAGDLDRLPREAELRARIGPPVVKMSFATHSATLYEWLDNRRNAQSLSAILGAHFQEFYDGIWPGANSLGHYDSLVNLELALQRASSEAAWAEQFEATEWPVDTSEDVDAARTSRDYLSKVAEYLDLEDFSPLWEWDEAVERAELEERRAGEAEEQDSSWRDDDDSETQTVSPEVNAVLQQQALVDGLFAGLAQTESRVDPPPDE